MSLPRRSWSEDGEPWDESDRACPHSFDYKVRATARFEARLREMVLREAAVPASQHFRTEQLQEGTERRKYLYSMEKQGLFLQASCIITDGQKTGVPRQILVSERAKSQFHDQKQDRYTQANACLFSTPFSDFTFVDNNRSLPFAILNSINNYSPFALFARKLLLPEDLVDCRFLGLGFNFKDPTKSYLHFIWQLRCEGTPEGLLVPARQTDKHDVPYWIDLNTIIQRDALQKAPIDRLVYEHLQQPHSKRRWGDDEVGFLQQPRFDKLSAGDEAPERQDRDAIAMDLLLTFQQRVHGNLISLGLATIDELRRALVQFLTESSSKYGLELQANETFLDAHRPRGDYLAIELLRQGKVHYRFLVELSASFSAGLDGGTLDRAQRTAPIVKTRSRLEHVERGCDAVFILQAVKGDGSAFAFQLPERISLPGKMPCHLIRIMTNAHADVTKIRVCEVVHGVILCRTLPQRAPDRLIVTQALSDECPRLPGGKIEVSETPELALRRELKEELGILAEHIAELRPILPQHSTPDSEHDIKEEGSSPSSGRNTIYHLTPFLVRLNSEGRQQVRKVLGQAPSFAQPRLIDQWLRTGFGFSTKYADEVMRRLTIEQMDAAAINLWGDIPYRFDVAISVAGPDAAAAMEFTRELRHLGLDVFHYHDFQYENWGQDLKSITLDVYRNRSRVVVVFTSQAYLDSRWSMQELAEVLARREPLSEVLLELKLDSTVNLPGVPDSIVWQPWDSRMAREMAEGLRRRLLGGT